MLLINNIFQVFVHKACCKTYVLVSYCPEHDFHLHFKIQRLQAIQISSVTVSNLKSEISNLGISDQYLWPIDCFIMTINNLKCKYKHS